MVFLLLVNFWFDLLQKAQRKASGIRFSRWPVSELFASVCTDATLGQRRDLSADNFSVFSHRQTPQRPKFGAYIISLIKHLSTYESELAHQGGIEHECYRIVREGNRGEVWTRGK